MRIERLDGRSIRSGPHRQWRPQQYEYLVYIASLDKRGMVIRDCAKAVSG